MLLRTCLACASVVALASAANAADMYRAPEPSASGYKDGPDVPVWAGFYVGVNGGYGWDGSSNVLGYTPTNFAGLSPSGGFGGGQIGYNWQGVWHPHLVLGVEADIQGSGIGEKASIFNGLGQKIGTSELELSYFGTARGRVGYAVDRALVYFTGGFAWGGLKKDVLFPHDVEWKKDSLATGYTIGGGIEYKLSPAWSVKAEYQYIDLGKSDLSATTAGWPLYSAYYHPIKEDAFNTIRVGINYQVGGVYEPLK